MTDIAHHVQGIVHEDTQAEGPGFDLTVSAIHEVREPGRVDFGAGELADADLSPVESSYRNPDDDYQWWELSGGQYLLEYNESLSGDRVLVVQPHQNVVERGATRGSLRSPLVQSEALTPFAPRVPPDDARRGVAADAAVGGRPGYPRQGERAGVDGARAGRVAPTRPDTLGRAERPRIGRSVPLPGAFRPLRRGRAVDKIFKRMR